MFITFEGLDFCGKSTQVELLKDYLVKKNRKVNILREPGGAIISEKIREILLDKKNSKMTMETELLLFSASRSQLVREIIIPQLNQGYYVISDRFHDSTTAYQGYGRGVPLNFVESLNKFVIQNALPDITFFIDIPVDEVVRRKSKIDLFELDRIELSKSGFYEKVRDGYLEISKSEDRFFTINGAASINEIHHMIISRIEDLKEQEKVSDEKI